MTIDVRLDLSAHCIETEIRRQYTVRINRYFKTGTSAGKTQLEAEISLLLDALEHFDFKQLRSGHPCLAGGSCDNIRLIRDAENRVRIQHSGDLIDAVHTISKF
jgi:hypothetical protein